MGVFHSVRAGLSSVTMWTEHKRRGFLLLAAVLVDVLLGLFDYLSGFEISLSVFYLIPVALVSRCAGKIEGILISLLCATTWLFADLASHHMYAHPAIPYWNALVRLAFFVIVSLALVRMRCSMDSLQEISRTDPLTGALNPRGFHEKAETEIERSRRYGHPIAVAYLDLDNFKAVNDTLGHSTGDELLARVAGLINDNMRKTDVLARLGGDEFVILFSETGSEAAQSVMDRIAEGISHDMHMKGWPVTLSVGLVTFLSPPASVDQMIQRADDLMYEAKNSGKNTVRSALYSAGPHRELR